VNLLGKDEVRSIASLSLVEFVMSYPGGVPDEEVPALIKQAIKCDLINSVHRLEYRRGKEEAPPTNAGTGSPENSSGDTGSPSAPPYGEPEACLLQNADAQKVQDAIQHLNRNEQTVIQFYYFRQETTNEIAVRLGCSVQNVRKIKRRALTRLRSLLER
jgi:RNA polymerase sigma factor (sigma-70 family)